MNTIPPLRPELNAAAREKLERIGLQLNRSASDVLVRIVEAVEEIEIVETITIKLKPEAEAPAARKGKRRLIVKKTTTYRGSF